MRWLLGLAVAVVGCVTPNEPPMSREPSGSVVYVWAGWSSPVRAADGVYQNLTAKEAAQKIWLRYSDLGWNNIPVSTTTVYPNGQWYYYTFEASELRCFPW